MYSANRYVIRHATAVDARPPRRLAALDSQRLLSGRTLTDGRPITRRRGDSTKAEMA